MIPLFDNKLLSAFLLLIDNNIQRRGEAFINNSGLFYPVDSDIYGKYAYAAPFKQLVNDTDISGANVISGVYLNNNYINIGESGLSFINHYKGILYFDNELPQNTIVSGNYSYKEFNIELTDQPEYKLLFETKYISNNFYNQVESGLSPDMKVCPAIFIKTNSMANKPFALGGMEDKSLIIRTVIIADNEFQKIGACNILKDMCYSPFYLVNSTPFDFLGNYTGTNYSFNSLDFDRNYFPWIMDVKVIETTRIGEFKDILKNTAIVDFHISTIKKHTY